MKNPFKFNPRRRTNLLGCASILAGAVLGTENMHGMVEISTSIGAMFNMTASQHIALGYGMIVMREGVSA